MSSFKRLRTAAPPSRCYRCEVCDFYSNTPHGLSCHRGKTGHFFAPATVGQQQASHDEHSEIAANQGAENEHIDASVETAGSEDEEDAVIQEVQRAASLKRRRQEQTDAIDVEDKRAPLSIHIICSRFHFRFSTELPVRKSILLTAAAVNPGQQQ